jgi:hypothetical protein
MRRRPYTPEEIEKRRAYVRAYQKLWHAKRGKPPRPHAEVMAKLRAMAITPEELHVAGAKLPPGESTQ